MTHDTKATSGDQLAPINWRVAETLISYHFTCAWVHPHDPTRVITCGQEHRSQAAALKHVMALHRREARHAR